MICFKSLGAMLPQRVILSVMGFFGVTVSFGMRACLSVAITDMIIPMNKTTNGNNFSVCPADISISALSIANHQFDYEEAERYNWTEKQQSWVLSSFYVGYLIAHIPGGIMAQKFGGKWFMALSVFLTAICNAMIPRALAYGGYNAVILLRILMGLFEGVLFPSLSVLLAAWVPERERAKLGSLTLSGPQAGNLLSFYLSGIILFYQPWPLVFYFWSFISMIWFILFILICYRDPASHPFITEKELIYLKVEMGQLKRHTNLPSTPWRSIFTSVPVIVLIISQMGNDCLWVTLAIDLPKYMKEVLGFSIDKVGLFSSIPYLFMWIVSILSGYLCDYLIERCYLTTVQARRLFTALSGIVPAILVVAASYAACNRLLAVILLTTAVGFMGNYYPGMRVNAFDLSPNYAGSIISIVNGSGAITGLTFPAFIGFMIPDSTIEQWRTVFWTILGVAIVRVSIYARWASADIQPWNNPKNSKYPDISTSHAEIHVAKTLHEYFSNRS